MTASEFVIVISIHLLIPVGGLLIYVELIKRINKEDIFKPPRVDLFLTFLTYGGLLLVTLTSLFWEWTGLASLGTFYLVVGGPFAMGFIAYRNYKKRSLSRYHRWTYKAGLLYFFLSPLTIGIILFLIKSPMP